MNETPAAAGGEFLRRAHGGGRGERRISRAGDAGRAPDSDVARGAAWDLRCHRPRSGGRCTGAFSRPLRALSRAVRAALSGCAATERQFDQRGFT
jgi:hypothetical protein